MASQKLTKSIRSDILKEIMAHKFDALDEKMRKRHAEMAVKCYEERFTPAEQKRMGELPNGWLPMENSIVVRTPRGSFNFYFAGQFLFGEKHFRRFQDRNKELQLNHDHPLLKDVEDFKDAEKDYRDLKEKTRREIGAVLGSVTTVNKLMATWPEIEVFVSKVMNRYSPRGGQVPMVVMKELNDKLDLPPEKKNKKAA